VGGYIGGEGTDEVRYALRKEVLNVLPVGALRSETMSGDER
jgi:hypothetical protein